jgi:hypothetical protein
MKRQLLFGGTASDALERATWRLLMAARDLLGDAKRMPADELAAKCVRARAAAASAADGIIRGVLAEQRVREEIAYKRPPISDAQARADTIADLADAADDEYIAILDEVAARRGATTH